MKRLHHIHSINCYKGTAPNCQLLTLLKKDSHFSRKKKYQCLRRCAAVSFPPQPPTSPFTQNEIRRDTQCASHYVLWHLAHPSEPKSPQRDHHRPPQATQMPILHPSEFHLGQNQPQRILSLPDGAPHPASAEPPLKVINNNRHISRRAVLFI